MRSAKWEQNGGGSHDSGEAGFLSGISDGISSTSQRPIFSSLNLATMREFEDIRRKFVKIFRLRVICPQRPQNCRGQTGTLL